MGEQESPGRPELEHNEADVDHALQCIEALDSIYLDMQAQRQAARELRDEVTGNPDAFEDSDVSPIELLRVLQGELDSSLQALNPRYKYVMDRLPADVPRPVLNEALGRYLAAQEEPETEDPERELRLQRITNLMASAGHVPERARDDVLFLEEHLQPTLPEKEVGRVAVRIVRSSPGPRPGTIWVNLTDPRAARIAGNAGPVHVVAEYPIIVEEDAAAEEGGVLIHATVDGVEKEFDTSDTDVFRVVTDAEGRQSLQVYIPGDRASVESISGALMQSEFDRLRLGADDAGNVAVQAAAGPLRNVAEGFEHREGVNPTAIPVAKQD
jgi:hypothetical protein